MGSFYTNAICSYNDLKIIEKYILDNKRNAYILIKEGDDKHIVLTEERCDSQSFRENNLFFRPLSTLTKNPLLGCIVQDSDDLFLCLFSRGEDIYELISSLEYSVDGEIKFHNVGALTEAFGGDTNELMKLHTTENARKHAFAEDYQKEIYSTIGVPLWSIGIGYDYLSEEPELRDELKSMGISIKEFKE